MLAYERQQRILELLRRQGGVGELIAVLTVPHPTVSRDLAALAARGELLRVRGGAVLPDSSNQITSDAAGSRRQVRDALGEVSREVRIARSLLAQGNTEQACAHALLGCSIALTAVLQTHTPPHRRATG